MSKENREYGMFLVLHEESPGDAVTSMYVMTFTHTHMLLWFHFITSHLFNTYYKHDM